MHLPHRISAIGAIVGYLHAGHQHRITACSRNILVEKGDIAQIVTLEFLPVALVGIEIDKQWMPLTGPVIGRQQQPVVAILVFARFARSEEHTSELQSLMRNSYAVFCLKKK